MLAWHDEVRSCPDYSLDRNGGSYFVCLGLISSRLRWLEWHDFRCAWYIGSILGCAIYLLFWVLSGSLLSARHILVS